ncbi:radical SAM protein [Candidatus Woesearchaeota archaeon]|nr:MAG: radical SAM protein [Candidatus Woesearchaeota archaeon]
MFKKSKMTAKLKFEQLKFIRLDGKTKVIFLKWFYFEIPNSELEKIGKYKLRKYSITFETSKKRAIHKFNLLINRGLTQLKSVLHNKNTIYIHKNSGIPLIGTNYFGLVDRGTNLIEIKPVTGCNLNCIYCSISEGINKKTYDFLVELDYLVEEFKKLAAIKKHPVEAHINAHGESLLYAEIVDLVEELRKIKNVETISINTNGLLLTEGLIDQLIKAGLDRLNISLNAINEELCRKLADAPYNLKHLKRILAYTATKDLDIIIAPILLPGFNEDLTELIEYSIKTIKRKQKVPKLGIQNFLEYSLGRKPTKQLPWNLFYKELKNWEEHYKVKLILNPNDFGIVKDKTLKKPFKKDQIITATIICNGRYPNERLAIAKDRLISVRCNKKTGRKVRIKITRSKHNVFTGTLS